MLFYKIKIENSYYNNNKLIVISTQKFLTIKLLTEVLK